MIVLPTHRVLGSMPGFSMEKFAAAAKGKTGETLLQNLELRLDNVVFRMGFGVSRTEARQLVRHNAILVNSKRTNIPSYQVKEGDAVALASDVPLRAGLQVRPAFR